MLLTRSARARGDNVSFMGSFCASGLGVSFDRRPHKVHAWVGAVRVHVVASGEFAHDGYGATGSIERALM